MFSDINDEVPLWRAKIIIKKSSFSFAAILITFFNARTFGMPRLENNTLSLTSEDLKRQESSALNVFLIITENELFSALAFIFEPPSCFREFRLFKIQSETEVFQKISVAHFHYNFFQSDSDLSLGGLGLFTF